MRDQDELAKEQGKEQKKLQQLQQQKQEQQVEGCPQETYAQLWDRSQAPIPSLDPAQYTQNNQR